VGGGGGGEGNGRAKVLTATSAKLCLKVRAPQPLGPSVMGPVPWWEVAHACALLLCWAPSLSVLQCTKPVVAVIHGACVGGGVDMVAACDIRYCSADAFFCIKEVDIGLAADVGTLQVVSCRHRVM
jgi:hypothetical protein